MATPHGPVASLVPDCTSNRSPPHGPSRSISIKTLKDTVSDRTTAIPPHKGSNVCVDVLKCQQRTNEGPNYTLQWAKRRQLQAQARFSQRHPFAATFIGRDALTRVSTASLRSPSITTVRVTCPASSITSPKLRATSATSSAR